MKAALLVVAFVVLAGCTSRTKLEDAERRAREAEASAETYAKELRQCEADIDKFAKRLEGR